MGNVNSEFSCEVVRIATIKPHPNADRLELATIEMKDSGVAGYTVVTGKGDFKPGDLAVYTSVDTVLQMRIPCFAFLQSKDHPERTTHRLRASRLRGVYSEGLLVPAKNALFGEDMAIELGVSQYINPNELKHPSTPADPNSKKSQRIANNRNFPEYEIASLKKSPYMFGDRDSVIVTEKVHGTNFRYGLLPRIGLLGLILRFFGLQAGWTFVVGSHRCIKSASKTGDGWYGEDLYNYVANINGLERNMRARKQFGTVWYAEIYGHTPTGAKIQDMTYGADYPHFRVFDCFHSLTGNWVNYGDWEPIAVTDMDWPIVPVLFVGEYDLDEIKALAEGKSVVGGPLREGVVVEPFEREGRMAKGKYVGEGYLTRKAG